jgi:hypothetical protein
MLLAPSEVVPLFPQPYRINLVHKFNNAYRPLRGGNDPKEVKTRTWQIPLVLLAGLSNAYKTVYYPVAAKRRATARRPQFLLEKRPV